jgi:predicted Zn-dependent protease
MFEFRRRFAPSRAALRAAAILGVVSLSACAITDTLRELLLVQAAVAQASGAAVGSVSVIVANHRDLTVSIDNWREAERSDKKRDLALILAKAAYAAYGLRAALEHVTVRFSTVHTALFIVTVRRVADGQSFQFRSSELIETTTADRTIPGPPESIALHLLPIGDVPLPLMDRMASRLHARFQIPVTMLPPMASYLISFNDRRHQVVADGLVADIQNRYSAVLGRSGSRIIAITAWDMYISTKNWQFTFSLRGPGNQVAVVSYARMRPEAFGNAPDDILLESRLRKMVMKDIGIMCYGFPLSQNPRSVLYGSIDGTDELDVMTEAFDPVD